MGTAKHGLMGVRVAFHRTKRLAHTPSKITKE